MTQDVADDQLLARLLCGSHDALGIGNGRCQWLFDEDVAAGLEGGDGIIGMAVGISIDRAEIRLQLGKRRHEVGMDRVLLQLRRKLARLGAVDEANDLVARIVVIGERMAAAHIAEAGNKDTDRLVGLAHLTAPEVMPRISCREKMT